MKFSRIVAMLPLLLILLAQCCKSNYKPVVTFMGIWKGNYGFPNEPLNNYFSIQVKAGGIIEELDASGEIIAEGKWIQTGDTLKATYIMSHAPFNQYTVEGIVQGAGMELKGSWGYADNAIDGGPFELEKTQAPRYHR